MTLKAEMRFRTISKKSWIAFFTRKLICASRVVSVTGCYHFSGNTTAGDVLSSVDVQKIAILDSTSENFDSLNHGSAVSKFYASRHFVPAWWNHKKPSPLADSMFTLIRNIRYYGLLPQHYHAGELTQLLYDSAFEDDATIRRSDMLLTDAFVSITRDLKYGRLSHHDTLITNRLHYHDSLTLLLLNSAFARNDLRRVVETQESPSAQYSHLRHALREALDTCRQDMRRAFLAGLVNDSLPESRKLVTLEVNLDRWRREDQINKRYILVNIPGCFLEVVEDDSIQFRSKVIVGTEKNQTPVLDGLVRSFIIYPYWNVPRGIAVNEILPNVKKDSLYLQNHHYEVIGSDGTAIDPSTIEWSSLHRNNFPYTIRQKEGVHNALGLVKFWFNNPYAVFLHDTNARLLFNREKRALSHGCVRVERAMELGRFLLKDNEVCSPEDLDQYLEFQKQMSIRIADPIPVHIRYLTCYYHAGKVEFYDDVYHEDRLETARVYERRSGQPKQVLVIAEARESR